MDEGSPVITVGSGGRKPKGGVIGGMGIRQNQWRLVIAIVSSATRSRKRSFV